MSSSATGQGIVPPTDWEDFAYDREDKPPPYTQEPIFEGSYNEPEEDLLVASRHLNGANCADSTEGGFINPAFNDAHHQQHLQNSPYPQQPQYQPSSEHKAPYQPGFEGYGPPTNYNGQNYSTLRYGSSTPLGIHETGQQRPYPAPIVSNLWPPGATHLPPVAGQNVVVNQPHAFAVQRPIVIVQPILEDPPNDYRCLSVFATLCCCWMLGIRALIASRDCRHAIEAGNRQLANEKSISARNTAYASIVFGILLYIVAGVIIGIRFRYLVK